MENAAGFEPANNRVATCPLKPLEYTFMARAKRIEHFSWVLETQAQPLYQARILVDQQGFEP